VGSPVETCPLTHEDGIKVMGALLLRAVAELPKNAYSLSVDTSANPLHEVVTAIGFDPGATPLGTRLKFIVAGIAVTVMLPRIMPRGAGRCVPTDNTCACAVPNHTHPAIHASSRCRLS